MWTIDADMGTAHEYRERAARQRLDAEASPVPAIRELLLRIAVQYERLAERLEAIEGAEKKS